MYWLQYNQPRAFGWLCPAGRYGLVPTQFAVEEGQHFFKIHPTQRFLHPIALLNPSDKVLVIFHKLLPGRQMLQENLQHIHVKTKSAYIGNV